MLLLLWLLLLDCCCMVVCVCMVLLTVGVFSGGVVSTSLLPRLWSHSSAGLLWYEFVVQQTS